MGHFPTTDWPRFGLNCGMYPSIWGAMGFICCRGGAGSRNKPKLQRGSFASTGDTQAALAGLSSPLLYCKAGVKPSPTTDQHWPSPRSHRPAANTRARRGVPPFPQGRVTAAPSGLGPPHSPGHRQHLRFRPGAFHGSWTASQPAPLPRKQRGSAPPGPAWVPPAEERLSEGSCPLPPFPASRGPRRGGGTHAAGSSPGDANAAGACDHRPPPRVPAASAPPGATEGKGFLPWRLSAPDASGRAWLARRCPPSCPHARGDIPPTPRRSTRAMVRSGLAECLKPRITSKCNNTRSMGWLLKASWPTDPRSSWKKKKKWKWKRNACCTFLWPCLPSRCEEPSPGEVVDAGLCPQWLATPLQCHWHARSCFVGGVGNFHHVPSLSSLIPFPHPPPKKPLSHKTHFSARSEEDAVLTASYIFLLAHSVDTLPKKVIYGQQETLTLRPH